MIPYGRHSIDQSDIDAVVDVLSNKFLTQGDTVPAFEHALCQYTQAEHCIAVNSATSGLHVACLALGIGTGDRVWTSPNSFAASANCARYCGATVDFVDIDLETGNISVAELEQKLVSAKAAGQLPAVLIVVHFAGCSCDMRSIHKLCKEYSIAIIEDAAHALGATYEKKPIGSCQYSDITVLSFHPVKSITTAEGGAILCNDSALAQGCRLYAKHGITRDTNQLTCAPAGDWYYQQLTLGFNYRLSDLHAALGISQLKRLDQFIEKRQQIAVDYMHGLASLPLSLPKMKDGKSSAWHLFVIRVPENKRTELYAQLKHQGIGVNVHYIPIHLHPYYQSLGFKEGTFKNAEKFYAQALSLPIFPALTHKQQSQVIMTLTNLVTWTDYA